MAQSTKPPVQQQGGQTKPQGQMAGTSTPTPQQGQTPVIRDWASI
jgi:hypothetical protein